MSLLNLLQGLPVYQQAVFFTYKTLSEAPFAFTPIVSSLGPEILSGRRISYLSSEGAFTSRARKEVDVAQNEIEVSAKGFGGWR
jgi:hypothetical protein